MTDQLLDGRYLVIRTLSSGGFGQTYLAQDTRIPGNPTCVVKKLQPLSTSPEQLKVARELFKREAETLARLGEHDQIPRLLAYVEQEFYTVQEYVDGHTLDAELQAGQRWSEQQVMQFLQDVLRVLVFVHDENVIHRDIKPANIIRRQRDGKLFLIDFGAIKEVRGQQPGQAATVMTGTMIGTIGYMPSEQALGKPRFSSDLFALGRIAIQASTGTRPDQLKEERGEVIWQPYAPQVSPSLVQVLTKMTRYHHEDRYQSAAEALQAVQNVGVSGGSSAANYTVPVTNVAATNRYELTLDWSEAGQARRQMIFPDQPSKHPGTMRIGRDPAQCDIVLVDPSVSGLHIEIFFNTQLQKFYVRNLRQNNPPLVDDQLLLGERPLNSGNVLRLGQTELRVSAIELRQYTTGQTPPVPSVQPQPINPQPVAETVQLGRSSSSQRPQAEQYASNIPRKNTSPGSTAVNPPKAAPKNSRIWTSLAVGLVLAGSAAYRSYDSYQRQTQQRTASQGSTSATAPSSSSTAKAQCGDASIDRERPFYRVLVINQEGNLNDIKMKHCQDAVVASSGVGIQVATFQNSVEAGEFVRYMSNYYPKVWTEEVTPNPSGSNTQTRTSTDPSQQPTQSQPLQEVTYKCTCQITTEPFCYTPNDGGRYTSTWVYTTNLQGHPSSSGWVCQKN